MWIVYHRKLRFLLLHLDRKEYRIGGAGNVALNLASLGANVSVLSMIGEDDDGVVLKKMFSNNEINTDFLLPARITNHNE